MYAIESDDDNTISVVVAEHKTSGFGLRAEGPGRPSDKYYYLVDPGCAALTRVL